MRLLLLLLLEATIIVCVCVTVSLGSTIGSGSVHYNQETRSYSFSASLDKTSPCWGTFDDVFLDQGWGKLYLHSGSSYDDIVQMTACGHLEAALTASYIYKHYLNFAEITFGKNVSAATLKPLDDHLETQEKWVNKQVQLYSNSSVYWHQVACVQAQYQGLMDGYTLNHLPNQALPSMALMYMKNAGDLFDLVPLLLKTPSAYQLKTSTTPIGMSFPGHCSALIKVAPDLSNMFFAHTSWFMYSATTRIVKYYDFSLSSQSGMVSQGVTFSSYPGFLNSFDDFYITSSGLVVIETSLNVFNLSMYSAISTQSIPCGTRTMVANRMASSGSAWTDIYSQYQSGTYNNQWMVVDTKKFIPKQQLMPGTMWLLEQLPGLVKSADVTDILNYGYWPSYNVPFFPEIYSAAGYAALPLNMSDRFNYQHCARANIFRRDQSKVDSITSLKGVMRSNNYKTDPLSLKNPEFAISSRFDLDAVSPFSAGGYDSKVCDYYNVKGMEFEALNGPTTENQPAFSWVGAFASDPHLGLPKTYNYDYIVMRPDN